MTAAPTPPSPPLTFRTATAPSRCDAAVKRMVAPVNELESRLTAAARRTSPDRAAGRMDAGVNAAAFASSVASRVKQHARRIIMVSEEGQQWCR